MLTITLSHLLGRGVRLEAHEAVALAREILAHPCGIATIESVQLGSDGSVTCAGMDGSPSVAAVAELLQTLLPDGTPQVPAPLRYAIARASGSVEAPRFASLADFSSALERFEQGSSRDVLRELLERVIRPSVSTGVPSALAVVKVTGQSAPTGHKGVLPRPTLVVSAPPEPAGDPSGPAPPPFFTSVTLHARPHSPAQPQPRSRRLAPGAAVALVASFATGFLVADEVTHRGIAIKRSASAAPHRSLPDRSAVNNNQARPNGAQRAGDVAGTRDVAPIAPEALTGSAAAPAGTTGEARTGDVDNAAAPVSRVRAIDAATQNAFSPAFSTDGSAIFFQTGGDRDADSAIDVTSAESLDGEARVTRVVDDGSHNYHAAPSPDGRFLAFDSDRDGQRGVYVADRDGSHARRVSGPGYAAVPTWSRSSTWLTYIRAEPDKPAVWNLWVQPAAGGRPRRVTTYRYGQTWGASWFPDDRRVAYSHEDTLVVQDLQTGRTTDYPTPLKRQLVRTPAVSPDGREIIFQVLHHGAWILDVATGSSRRVITDATAEEFAWSPDGRRVAFHSHRNGRWSIYILLVN